MKRIILLFAAMLCFAGLCRAQFRTPDYRELGDSETVRAVSSFSN